MRLYFFILLVKIYCLIPENRPSLNDDQQGYPENYVPTINFLKTLYFKMSSDQSNYGLINKYQEVCSEIINLMPSELSFLFDPFTYYKTIFDDTEEQHYKICDIWIFQFSKAGFIQAVFIRDLWRSRIFNNKYPIRISKIKCGEFSLEGIKDLINEAGIKLKELTISECKSGFISNLLNDEQCFKNAENLQILGFSESELNEDDLSAIGKILKENIIKKLRNFYLYHISNSVDWSTCKSFLSGLRNNNTIKSLEISILELNLKLIYAIILNLSINVEMPLEELFITHENLSNEISENDKVKISIPLVTLISKKKDLSMFVVPVNFWDKNEFMKLKDQNKVKYFKFCEDKKHVKLFTYNYSKDLAEDDYDEILNLLN